MRPVILASLTVLAACGGLQGSPHKGNAALSFHGDGCVEAYSEPVPALTALTVEAFVRAPLHDASFPTRMPLITVGSLAELWIAADGTGFSQPGSVDSSGYKSSAVLLDEQVHHVAAIWTSTSANMFIDGVRRGQGASWEAFPVIDAVWIGCSEGAVRRSTLVIDEVRVSSDARYLSNFVVPTQNFQADGTTVGLWHLDGGKGTQVADEVERFEGELSNADWEAGLVDQYEPVIE